MGDPVAAAPVVRPVEPLPSPTGRKVAKVALGLPFYAGSDPDCLGAHLTFLHYLGRLQERCRNRADDKWLCHDMFDPSKCSLPEGELRPDDPDFVFYVIERTHFSLIGAAREFICEAAIAFGLDAVLFFDSDMVFDPDLFLRLWRDDVPAVAALAFTGRLPINPVIYKFAHIYDYSKNSEATNSEVVLDYPRDQLFRVDGFGAGVVLIRTDALRKIQRPWFQSTGCGEDLQFCFQAKKSGVPIYVDSRAKTSHKPTFPTRWHNEAFFDDERKARGNA